MPGSFVPQRRNLRDPGANPTETINSTPTRSSSLNATAARHIHNSTNLSNEIIQDTVPYRTPLRQLLLIYNNEKQETETQERESFIWNWCNGCPSAA